MKTYSQYNYSVYKHNKIINDRINFYSESNCWVISAFHVLQYLADTRWVGMPKSWQLETYNPKVSESNIYSLYYNSQGDNISNKINFHNSVINEYELMNNSFYWPTLYTQVRKYVSDKFRHIEYGSVWDTSNIIENIARLYGYNVNAVEHVFWGLYMNTATKKLDEGLPLIWATLSGTYGSHSMAVCGYRYYYKTTGWWIFKFTNYKLFYELRDGHNLAPRYYDMSGHIGFAAIVSLEV